MHAPELLRSAPIYLGASQECLQTAGVCYNLFECKSIGFMECASNVNGPCISLLCGESGPTAAFSQDSAFGLQDHYLSQQSAGFVMTVTSLDVSLPFLTFHAQLASSEPLVPVTDSENRSTLPAKLMLTEAGLPPANLRLPSTVSGGGSSSHTLIAKAEASTTSPKPAQHLTEAPVAWADTAW